MTFEKEAYDLKEQFNNLIKLYKKHEKKKAERMQLSSDFYAQDEELKRKISLFYMEYRNFIKPRKNSLGTFKVDDYIAYKRMCKLEDKNLSDTTYKNNFSSDSTHSKVMSDDINTMGSLYHQKLYNNSYYRNTFSENPNLYSKDQRQVSGPFINTKDIYRPVEQSNFNTQSMYPHDMQFSRNSMFSVIQNKIPEQSFISHSKFNNRRIVNDKFDQPFSGNFNQAMSYKIQQPHVYPVNTFQKPIQHDTKTSFSSDIKSSSYSVESIKSPPNLGMHRSFKTPMFNSNYPFSSKNIVSPSHINNPNIVRSPNLQSKSPNMIYDSKQPTVTRLSYPRQTMPMMQTTGFYHQNSSDFVSNNSHMSTTHRPLSSTFYDKYVQNQVSINDIFQSKKAKTPEAKPIILNKCTLTNKKIDVLHSPAKFIEHKTIEKLTDKELSVEARNLLYEICDNFVEHIIVSTGNLADNNNKCDKDDLKMVLKMEFGIEF